MGCRSADISGGIEGVATAIQPKGEAARSLECMYVACHLFLLEECDTRPTASLSLVEWNIAERFFFCVHLSQPYILRIQALQQGYLKRCPCLYHQQQDQKEEEERQANLKLLDSLESSIWGTGQHEYK